MSIWAYEIADRRLLLIHHIPIFHSMFHSVLSLFTFNTRICIKSIIKFMQVNWPSCCFMPKIISLYTILSYCHKYLPPLPSSRHHHIQYLCISKIWYAFGKSSWYYSCQSDICDLCAFHFILFVRDFIFGTFVRQNIENKKKKKATNRH